MQSMVLTMAFGTWSGKFDNVQEALSFQANLANVGHLLEVVDNAKWVIGCTICETS